MLLLWLYLAMTQLFFHSFFEKILAKIMVDLFLFSFLRLGRHIDSMIPHQKGMSDTEQQDIALASDDQLRPIILPEQSDND